MLKYFLIIFILFPAAYATQTPCGPQLAALVSDRLQMVEVAAGMREFDKQKGVQMLTADEREALRIIIRDGIAYDNKGNIVPDSQNAKHNIANYVMDSSGNFYLFDERVTPLIRHSSIFDEGPVAGAGNIQIKNGKIVYCDSDSGHYPSKPLFPQVIVQLKASGTDTSTFQADKYYKKH